MATEGLVNPVELGSPLRPHRSCHKPITNLAVVAPTVGFFPTRATPLEPIQEQVRVALHRRNGDAPPQIWARAAFFCWFFNAELLLQVAI